MRRFRRDTALPVPGSMDPEDHVGARAAKGLKGLEEEGQHLVQGSLGLRASARPEAPGGARRSFRDAQGGALAERGSYREPALDRLAGPWVPRHLEPYWNIWSHD